MTTLTVSTRETGVSLDLASALFVAPLRTVRSFCHRGGRVLRACEWMFEEMTVQTVAEYFGPLAMCRALAAAHVL